MGSPDIRALDAPGAGVSNKTMVDGAEEAA